ncbi:MAG: methyltransferase domain-containing protein [Anaerolineae bacterium]|nr:MAG: methyltransferase domain-containing protein [Anaerolineae bacterium]
MQSNQHAWQQVQGRGDSCSRPKCTVCNAADIVLFFEMPQVPVHCNLLWPRRDQAISAPKGDIRLGFCQDCGHIFNLAFDPALMAYTQDYENSLHFSPRFQDYAESLARRLIERHDLYGKGIIELGCGKGDFLRLLCDLGGNRGFGFDPSYVPEHESEATAERITFIQDFYSERYASHEADFICCRHVLEHVQFPRDFLTGVRNSIGHRSETVVFFEVPNALFTLRDLGIWDLIYEHCSYFNASSLSRLFTLCGFNVHSITEAYDSQFLCIEALPGEGSTKAMDDFGNDMAAMACDVRAFADRYRSKLQAWQRNLARMVCLEQRVVIWGAGSKGVTFLNGLETRDLICYAVDINPRKQGMYLAGSGQQIVPPEFLPEYQPDVVIVMNPIYEDEIRQRIAQLGLTPRIVCV